MAVAALPCLLMASACSKSSKSATTTTAPAAASTTAAATTTAAADSSTTTTTALAGSTTTSPTAPPATARLTAMNITLADLPKGWTGRASTSSSNSVFDTCAADLKVTAHTVAKAQSDEFSLAQGTGQLGLQTTTGQLDGAGVATALVAKLGDRAFADCVTKAFVKAVGSQATGTLSPVAGLPKAGDDVQALQGQFALTTAAGQKVTILVEVIAVRTGSIVSTISATATNATPDGPLLAGVLDKVAARQKA
ncbi:MAG: hypothetical protein JWN46_1893 [Acidimicrobiales bacterium]|nr:hypothetical protein [Acidimicrobiales bacterium]